MVDEQFDYSAFGDPNTGIETNIFSLGNNYPNPASHQTNIPFQLVQGADLRVEIINNRGAVADVLLEKYMPAGSHMVSWDCSNHPAGLYMYQMRTGGKTLNGKVLVIH
jgi:hypothetical protein